MFQRTRSPLEKTASEEADADKLNRKGCEQNNTPVESSRNYFCNCVLCLLLENADWMQKDRTERIPGEENESWELT